MTYDLVLCKEKPKASDTPDLIAMVLSDNIECPSVGRFPKSKVADHLASGQEDRGQVLPFALIRICRNLILA